MRRSVAVMSGISVLVLVGQGFASPRHVALANHKRPQAHKHATAHRHAPTPKRLRTQKPTCANTLSGRPANRAACPVLGALAPSQSYASLYSSGFREAVIVASWAEIEPSDRYFSPSAIAAFQTQINDARAAGLSVSLDIGVQYAPSWVFDLPGGTRYVDQYGDQFGGAAASGDDVPNAMTDLYVRHAMARYLRHLGKSLTGIASVRIGGGPDNELRYPAGTKGSQPNAFWFYDASSQALLPSSTRGWTPGTGTPARATIFLTAYNHALVNYGTWLVNQAVADFAAPVKVELLLPDWGDRPGFISAAEHSLLVNTPNPVNEGLDWTDLLPSFRGQSRVVAYSTWADATTGNASNPDPAAYIHGILPARMLAGGESTGNGTTTDAGMDLMLHDATNWHWYAVNWMFHDQTQAPQQVAEAFAAAK